MDSRVDNIPAQSILTRLATDRQTLNDLKAKQYVGPASLKVNLNSTTNTWDVNGDAVAPYVQKNYRVTFTPTTAKNIYAELTYNYSISGGDGFETLALFPDPNNGTADNYRSWVVSLGNDANNVTLSLKFYVKCVGTGTITWVAI